MVRHLFLAALLSLLATLFGFLAPNLLMDPAVSALPNHPNTHHRVPWLCGQWFLSGVNVPWQQPAAGLRCTASTQPTLCNLPAVHTPVTWLLRKLLSRRHAPPGLYLIARDESLASPSPLSSTNICPSRHDSDNIEQVG